MVNNGLTFQEQSWVLEAGEGAQLVLIPDARADNQEVTAILEEHKLFFNLHVIALMFMYESQLCDALAVPTTNLNECNINQCIGEYVTKWQHQVPYGTFKELSRQGELFKHTLQRIILLASFDVAMASKCKVICMWIEGLKKALAYAKLDSNPNQDSKLRTA